MLGEVGDAIKTLFRSTLGNAFDVVKQLGGESGTRIAQDMERILTDMVAQAGRILSA